MTLGGVARPDDRDEVEKLYGECLLRLQAFEIRLKATVATHRFSGSLDMPDADQTKRINETRRKTMGALVGDLMGSILVASGQEGAPDADEDLAGVGFDFTLQIVLRAEDYSRIVAEHRDLVAIRNSLVHHFLEKNNLTSERGRLQARDALTSALERVRRADLKLVGWMKDLERARRAMADELARPEVQDWIAAGRIPWSTTKIVHALLDAVTELTQDDWTSVEAAATWIASRHPHERPEKYGCRSWRQVIHESQLFELQLRKMDGRRHAWYRPRVKKAAGSVARDSARSM